MSRFFSHRLSALKPYVPGEQPRERKYLKLNTNESPFPPSETAVRMAKSALSVLMLYPDPTQAALRTEMADALGIKAEQVIMTNGSDEALNFAFAAFCDDTVSAVFPDITYGFYRVFAEFNQVPYREIPLTDDFRLKISDYLNTGATVFIANPNAPTGIALNIREIEQLVSSNRNNIVVIDEAYVDFGAESAVGLINKYDNLVVIGTFSKSRSMAGARLGYAAASTELIADLERIRYSTNPYNVNSTTFAAGIGVLKDADTFKDNCKRIIEAREWTRINLASLGFKMTDSSANFLFAEHDDISGEELYKSLKERGVLIRHFNDERIKNHNRITIGNMEQMQVLIDNISDILRGRKREKPHERR